MIVHLQVPPRPTISQSQKKKALVQTLAQKTQTHQMLRRLLTAQIRKVEKRDQIKLQKSPQKHRLSGREKRSHLHPVFKTVAVEKVERKPAVVGRSQTKRAVILPIRTRQIN